MSVPIMGRFLNKKSKYHKGVGEIMDIKSNCWKTFVRNQYFSKYLKFKKCLLSLRVQVCTFSVWSSNLFIEAKTRMVSDFERSNLILTKTRKRPVLSSSSALVEDGQSLAAQRRRRSRRRRHVVCARASSSSGGQREPPRRVQEEVRQQHGAPDLSALHYCINKHRCLLKIHRKSRWAKCSGGRAS